MAARETDGVFSQIMKAHAASTMSAVGTIAVFQTMMLSITASIIGRQAIMQAMPWRTPSELADAVASSDRHRRRFFAVVGSN